MEILGLKRPGLHTFRPNPIVIALLALLVGPMATAGALTPANVPLFYSVSEPPDGRGELDSVGLWVGPGASAALLFITDKTMDSVEIHDAIHNTYVGRLGSSGSGIGQMSRPNGVVVGNGFATSSGPRDIVYVVERDNERVSAWLIPFMYPLGFIGIGDLSQPYGIAYHVENGVPQVWVTSTGYTPQRVTIFDLSWDPQTGLQSQLNRWFYVPAPSVLETIVVDAVSRRVLLCDEAAFDIMVFDFQGTLLTRFGAGIFTDDPEGMALYDTGEGSGYLIVSDQVSLPMEFEVFDRQTYQHLGSFSGPTTGTDGLTLTQAALPNLPNGSLFAVHADISLHGYDWQEIASALGLCVNDCATSEAQETTAPRKSGILSSLPNPFNPSTTIRYRVAQRGPVTLTVFDLQGRAVQKLVERSLDAGDHQVVWRGTDEAGRTAPAGVYFVQMMSAGEVSTEKLTLVK